MLRTEDCIPGTLVECIDDSGVTLIEAGQIYMITEVWPGEKHYLTGRQDLAVSVDFLQEPAPFGDGWIAYDRARFCLPSDKRRAAFKAELLASAPKQKERV